MSAGYRPIRCRLRDERSGLLRLRGGPEAKPGGVVVLLVTLDAVTQAPQPGLITFDSTAELRAFADRITATAHLAKARQQYALAGRNGAPIVLLTPARVRQLARQCCRMADALDSHRRSRP